MLAIERRNLILARLQSESKVLVSDLSQEYGVTEETIRRDLDKLEKQGFAKKTYGGAVILDGMFSDLPYTIRKETNIKSKQKIAKLVGKMVKDGDCIAIDSSSTSLYVIKEIKDKNDLTIITNSIEILLELADKKDWKVFSTGGSLRKGALALVGYQAERMIDNFHVDKAIISCKGVDTELGLTDSIELDAEIKKHILRAGSQKILVVDNSKFDKKSFAKIDKLSTLNVIITDEKPEKKWEEVCEEKEIQLIYQFE